MKNKELLIELIRHLDAYESGQTGDQPLSLNDFTAYLNALGGGDPAPMRRIEGRKESFSQKKKRTAPNNVSILLALMYRYVRVYIKKALKDSPIQTADEFSFLITLMTYESMTKTELIMNQVMEKTSGTEIITNDRFAQPIVAYDIAAQGGGGNWQPLEAGTGPLRMALVTTESDRVDQGKFNPFLAATIEVTEP